MNSYKPITVAMVVKYDTKRYILHTEFTPVEGLNIESAIYTAKNGFMGRFAKLGFESKWNPDLISSAVTSHFYTDSWNGKDEPVGVEQVNTLRTAIKDHHNIQNNIQTQLKP